MGKLIVLLLLIFIFTDCYAEGLCYSGIARNSTGTIVKNQYVSVKIQIVPNSDSNNPVYVETHYVHTDSFGSYSIIIGNGSDTSGSLNEIDIQNDDYVVQLEIDTERPFDNYILINSIDFIRLAKVNKTETSQNSQSGILKAFNDMSDREGWTYTGQSETLGTPDTWTAMSTTNAPSGRGDHSMIWTGKKLIVWGGDNIVSRLNDGAIYNPSTESWTTLPECPIAGRNRHSAIWTGNEMIIWGGYYGLGVFNNGAKYNPETNTWTLISTTNAPTARLAHSTVWTGTEMIIWGGVDASGSTSYNDGYKYNPSTDSWTQISSSGLTARHAHEAVWTGTEMIIYGGTNGTVLTDGKKYNPSTDTWSSVSASGLSQRLEGLSLWTGREMIVWGGAYSGSYLNDGKKYNPTTNSWTSISASGLAGRHEVYSIWTGTEMIVWGGRIGASSYTNDGKRYNPDTDSWTALTSTNAPTQRQNRWFMVWTGSEMIVWGGWSGSSMLNTGGKLSGALSIYWYVKD